MLNISAPKQTRYKLLLKWRNSYDYVKKIFSFFCCGLHCSAYGGYGSLGLLLENPIFIDEFTGAKNLSLLCDIKRLVSQAQIGDTLRRVGLNPSDKRPFRKYSLGMKQRLGIAAAIVESPDLILLDEPFNALDESGIKEIRDLLRELRQKGKLIVLTCHDRQQMESLADEIIAMREGRIVNVDKNCHEEV